MLNEKSCSTRDTFSNLQLNDKLIRALEQLGYSSPTPIQRQLIPHLLKGSDAIGQAQTGTGKTAAFALPILHNIKTVGRAPQALILTPTRELAIQVSDAIARYGSCIKKLRVLPVYGGQSYHTQQQQLRRGVDIIIGTPGRTIDLVKKKHLNLGSVKSFVLDEADEMLKMGFLDDVTWILEQTPDIKQTALFSATMPLPIRSIARKYLSDPVEVTVRDKTVTAQNIEQAHLVTANSHEKNRAISTLLEAEDYDGILIFVRTRTKTVELADFISSQGYKCGPLNGDIPQNQRLRMIEQLKTGQLDIVVATDVAARGLDLDRISHVINYDTPYDNEAYIHRIGRTGRAGRKGKAFLLITPREKRMVKNIERHSGCTIPLMKLPPVNKINERRVEAFYNKISAAFDYDLTSYEKIINSYCSEKNVDIHRVAAVLSHLLHEKKPLLLKERKESSKRNIKNSLRTKKAAVGHTPLESSAQKKTLNKPKAGMDRYRIELGHDHGVTPKNIVGAIANEADLDAQYIGRISIYNDYSTVDLPYGMPRHVLKILQKARVFDRTMQMKRDNTLGLDQPTNIGRKKRGRKNIKSSAAS